MVDFRIHQFVSGRAARKYRPLDDTLISLCLDKPPQRYLEIGTREGGSLTAVLRHSVPHPEFLTVCDEWGKNDGGSGRGNHNHIEKVLEEEGYEGEKIWLDGSSFDLIPTLVGAYDLILVDGDHSQEGASTDLRNVWPLLEVSGFVVMDDTRKKAHIMQIAKDWADREDARIIHIENRIPGNVVLQKIHF
jgi:predicted O-methyltransferase YrrM